MKSTPSESDLKTLLCSDDTVTASAADLATIRQLGDGVLSCFASLGDLQEPFKSEFMKIKNEINTVLAALPPTDQAPSANQANGILSQILSMFQYTQSMMTGLTSFAKSQQAERNTALASITTEVEKAVGEKIKLTLASGDYVPKADVETKIVDAIAGAKAGWETALKLVFDRRTLLASEKLVVPGDETLSSSDFDAKKVTATARLEKLKPFTALPQARVTQLAWDVDEASFNTALSDIEAAGSKKSGGGNPGAVPALKPETKSNLREQYRKLGF